MVPCFCWLQASATLKADIDRLQQQVATLQTAAAPADTSGDADKVRTTVGISSALSK